MNFKNVRYTNRFDRDGYIKPVTLALSKRVYPTLMAHKLVGVQPLSTHKGTNELHHPYPKKYNHKEWN